MFIIKTRLLLFSMLSSFYLSLFLAAHIPNEYRGDLLLKGKGLVNQKEDMSLGPLAVSSNKKMYIATDPISITVKLTNRTSQMIPIGLTDPSAFCRFSVSYLDDRPVPLTLWGKRYYAVRSGPDYIERPFLSGLVPGQSVSLIYQLNRLYDMTLPGKYTIKVSTQPGIIGKGSLIYSQQITIVMAGDDSNSIYGRIDIQPRIPNEVNPFAKAP